MVEQSDIHESTLVGQTSWYELKVGANDAGYLTTSAHAALSDSDKVVVAALRAAQSAQANELALETTLVTV